MLMPKLPLHQAKAGDAARTGAAAAAHSAARASGRKEERSIIGSKRQIALIVAC
jgi:hypothetical protein